MDEQQPKAEPTPEDVQHDMQATRAHLGAGMQALGDKAVGYAQDVADAVEDTRQGAMDALHGVQHAAANASAFVGRALDVRRHVRRHPWPAVALAVATGFACGRFLGRR